MSSTERIPDVVLWDSMRLKAGIPLLASGRPTSPLCSPSGLPFKLLGLPAALWPLPRDERLIEIIAVDLTT